VIVRVSTISDAHSPQSAHPHCDHGESYVSKVCDTFRDIDALSEPHFTHSIPSNDCKKKVKRKESNRIEPIRTKKYFEKENNLALSFQNNDSLFCKIILFILSFQENVAQFESEYVKKNETC